MSLHSSLEDDILRVDKIMQCKELIARHAHHMSKVAYSPPEIFLMCRFATSRLEGSEPPHMNHDVAASYPLTPFFPRRGRGSEGDSTTHAEEARRGRMMGQQKMRRTWGVAINVVAAGGDVSRVALEGDVLQI